MRIFTRAHVSWHLGEGFFYSGYRCKCFQPTSTFLFLSAAHDKRGEVSFRLSTRLIFASSTLYLGGRGLNRFRWPDGRPPEAGRLFLQVATNGRVGDICLARQGCGLKYCLLRRLSCQLFIRPSALQPYTATYRST
jgi:hypothetical protein